MFDISAADILKGVFLPLITLFIAIVKTPFRIRQENHGKLRALIEAVESNKGERIQLLLFRDYMRSKNASLLELQQLLALPDAIRALELYRFTHSQQQILRVTPNGFMLSPRADNGFKRFLLSCRYFVQYLFFVSLLVLLPALAQLGMQRLGVIITPSSVSFLPGAKIANYGQLLFPVLLFLMTMGWLLYMTFKQLSQAGNTGAETRFFRYYQQALKASKARELLKQLREFLGTAAG
ncbi:hypothetical protein [Serratia grimesii]|uniref:hypothetical protein n=1 Tax=Serratia grimesii TaxID=82995 RepID=UPI0039AEBB1C